MRQFLAWLAIAHPSVTDPGEITRNHVHGWSNHLAESGAADATRLVRLESLSLFFRWLADEPASGVTINPADKVQRPVARAPLVPVVSDADVRKLLGGIGGTTFADVRDAAIIRLLFDAGPRRAELVGLDVSDIELREGVVHVTGKGRKPRVAAMSPKTVLAMSRYRRLGDRHPGAADAARFLTARTNAHGTWRLTCQGVAEMLARRCRSVGLDPINPHRAPHCDARHARRGCLRVRCGDLDGLGWSRHAQPYGRALAAERAIVAAHALKIGDRY